MSQLTWVLCGDILGQNLCFWRKNTFLRYAVYNQKISKLITKEKDWRKGGLTCVAWYILCVKVEEGQRGNSVLDSNLFIFSWDQYLVWQVLSCWLVLRWIVDIQLWDVPRGCYLYLCLWYSTLSQTAMMFFMSLSLSLIFNFDTDRDDVLFRHNCP